MIDGVMNYTGSKFKLLDQILPQMDINKSKFVDVFAGGGSVYVNILNNYESIQVNDIITELIGIHKGISISDEIIERTKDLCPGKNNAEAFSELRQDYNNDPSADKLWALMLSSTNNMMRFNMKFKYNQTYGNRGWNINTDKKVEIFKNELRIHKDKIKFTSKPFYDIEIVKDTMYYCDPPYGRIKDGDNISKKQISEAGYNAFWKQSDDIKLYEYLHSINEIGSSFMVSGVLHHNDNTCWMLDKLIKDGFEYSEIDYDYNKVSRIGNKNTTEIIIKNY